MFSKFKKVLVSLALASSLALAPMNVSAVDLTQSDSNGETNVYAKGSQFATKYTVEVPESVTIDLNEKKCNADNADYLSIKLKESADFDGESLKVTPNFSLLSENEPKVMVKYGEDNDGKPLQEAVDVSTIFQSSNLLKFGTLENGNIKVGSDVATFAESDKTAKTIGLIVDETEAMKARKAIPNCEEDFDGKKCDPEIAENQQIGKITYECALVASAAAGN